MTDFNLAQIEQIQASLGRALLCPNFLDLFYQDFFENATGAIQFFAVVDMERQKRKLESSLKMVVSAAAGDLGSDFYLEHLARLHQRYHIPPEMYEIWFESLVVALRQCDPEFVPELEQCWQQVLQRYLNIMARLPALES